MVSLTSYFSVPKGEDDVRMVYDGTKSGLNKAMWVPRFPLPTADSHLRALEPGTFCADSDIGEMFLNFILHEGVRSLCGVDFSKIFGEELAPGAKVICMGTLGTMRYGTEIQPISNRTSCPCG